LYKESRKSDRYGGRDRMGWKIKKKEKMEGKSGMNKV
jgi:hypothetical protein